MEELVTKVQQEEDIFGKHSHIDDWISDIRVPYHMILFLPEAFFFGNHFRTLGRTKTFYLYRFLMGTGILFAVAFFLVAQPLDKAWRCYPDPSMRKVNIGRCDVAASNASSTYSKPGTWDHTTAWWVIAGTWLGSHVIVLVLYMYSSCAFKTLYVKHLHKLAAKWKRYTA